MDRSHRKHSEAQGKDYEALYRVLVEGLNEYAIFTMDMGGRITSWNEGVERVLGYSSEEFVGQPFSILFREEEITSGEPEKELTRAAQAGHSADERWHKRKDESLIWVDGAVTSLRDEAGAPNGFFKVMRDATARKSAENALQRAQSRLADLVDSITEIFIAVDCEWRIAWLNRRAMQETGLTGASTGRILWEVFPEIRGTEIEQAYRQAMERREAVKLETFWAPTEQWYEYHLQPTSDGLSALILNITERKQLEQKLREAARLESLGLLAGGIAHDFNNLLTGILGGASFLLHKVPEDNADIRIIAEMISRSAEKAAKLTSQMLAYSGRGRFVMRAIDLNQQIREILPLAASAVPNNFTIDLKLSPELPLIEGDPTQIDQVIMNLLINASEAFESSQGMIALATDVRQWTDADLKLCSVRADDVSPGPFVCFSVTDTGSGMDAATRLRIFEPFFTTKFTGRGLGLAAVTGIVRGHHGAISVTSQPGEGSRFVVGFPVVSGLQMPSATRGEARRAAPSQSKSSPVVLIVDDEPSVRDIARAMLENAGYKVLLAVNGQEAVERFRGHSDEIGLVLLDMTMPVMPGEQALRQLRAIKPEVRVIASSGYTEEDARRRFGVGLNGFLQKPYTTAQLLDAVAGIFAG